MKRRKNTFMIFFAHFLIFDQVKFSTICQEILLFSHFIILLRNKIFILEKFYGIHKKLSGGKKGILGAY